MKKRILTLFFVLIYTVNTMTALNAATDRDILSDPVANIYQASTVGESIVNNMNFADVPLSHWAKEPITRLGALSVVKGYNEGNAKSYRPDQSVSNQETLAFLLRVIGQEAAALQAAENIVSGEDDPLVTIWSRGYLQIASNLGIITAAELGDGLVLDQTLLDPEFNFLREAPTSREQVAKWLVDAVNAAVPDSIAPIYEPQKIFELDDWETIGQTYLPYVEAVMQAGIMVGDGASFNPQGELTRAEMAQIIVNIDDILYNTMGLTLKGGVVGYISDSAFIGTLNSDTKRTILIRNNDGLIDQVELVYESSSYSKVAAMDVPVLNPNGVVGLNALQEGDYVTYVVDDTNKEMKYIHSRGINSPIKVKGILQPLDLVNGQVSIENESGMTFTYKMIEGLYSNADQTIQISYSDFPVTSAPVSNTVTLTLQNNLVTLIEFDGAMPLTMEVSGIVKEINPTLGFMTIESWSGEEMTKYFTSDVEVEKENYYDSADEIGYIDEVFPDYRFDERDTTIDAIEAGDIVHIMLKPSNLQYIDRVSAKTNYTVRFGEVIEIADKGALGLTVRLAYDDTTIGTLDVESTVPVMKSGMNIGTRGLKTGDIVKVLINQAVLAPGQMLESVKHIDIDPYGNILAKVYMGEFGQYDEHQNTIGLLNGYELSKTGWTNYNSLTTLTVPSNEIEIFHDGKQVSLNYADNYLRTSNMKMYVVTEEYYDDERISRIIFEDGRGDVLDASNVIYSNGYDVMRLVSQADSIGLDAGTIVIKNDHIVSTSSILSPDYAQVVLGDEGSAVVVNITPEPNNDAISVFRGRVDDIETSESFSVTSHSVLKDMIWIYSPIEREFTISYDTKIVDENGLVPVNEFIDYTENSKVDEVYTIIAEGTKATHLVKNPYATEGVVGEIYEVDIANNTVKLKDALVYDSGTKLWEELSYRNNYADILAVTETIIIKNNEVIELSELEFGDKVRAMITVDLAEQVKIEGDRTATGYILFVEE